jgi:alkylhydroperoxidase family enzyme
MGLRSAVAQHEGLDEAVIAKVPDYQASDLGPRSQVALRLADAYILGLGQVPDDLRAEARANLSEEELVDIGLMLFRSSSNKVRVALAADDPEVRIRPLDED